MLTQLVLQQVNIRKIGFGARKIVYIRLAGVCKDKLNQLEKERQLILATLE